ncbi:hypothetical protein BGZ81_001674 [Podila clonocystis]|nr:hypothetical protein BGZ81_001674 [Podila clonocystis]
MHRDVKDRESNKRKWPTVEEELAEEDARLEAELEAQYQSEMDAKKKAEEEEEEQKLAKLEKYIHKKRLAKELEKWKAQRASDKDVEVQTEGEDEWTGHGSEEEDEWAGLGLGEKEDEPEGDEEDENDSSNKESKEEENDSSDKESEEEEGEDSEEDVSEAGEDDEGTDVDYTTCKLPAAYHIVLNLWIGNKEKGFCHSRKDLDPRSFDIIRGKDSYELTLVRIKDIIKELPRFRLPVDLRLYLQPNPSTPQKDHWELVEENFFPSLERVWHKEARKLGKDGNPVGAAAKLDFYVYGIDTPATDAPDPNDQRH